MIVVPLLTWNVVFAMRLSRVFHHRRMMIFVFEMLLSIKIFISKYTVILCIWGNIFRISIVYANI
jgi:hypothetical protein